MNKWAFILVFLLFTQCRRDEENIPNVAIDLYLNVNEPDLFDLYPVGGWVYYTGGSRGLIIYHKSFDEYAVFDRHSPYNVGAGCIVEVQDDNILIQDPCSESQWILTDGSVVSGPTSQPLKEYQNTFVNPTLHIYN